MKLIQKVEKTIRKERLFLEGDTIAVAVSGGSDSVALLHILHVLSAAWHWKLIVIHINHQFRGAESDKEAAETAKLAKQLGLPCETGVLDIPEFMKQSGMNAQVAARQKRYEFLYQMAEKHGANRIALGHHADDQAETVLMRMIRGTGASGLTGIPIRRVEKKVELIRPLLRIYKAEIAEYCFQESLNYSKDSSNEERKYFRNQVRLDVLPFLQKYNHQLPQSLNRLSEVMEAENDYLEAETARVLKQHVSVRDSGYYFSRENFVLLPAALQRRLIKLILNCLSEETNFLDFSKIELIRSAVQQMNPASTILDISEFIHFIREYDQISLVHRRSSTIRDYHYLIDSEPGELVISEAGCIIQYGAPEMTTGYNPSAILDKYTAVFDLDALVFPLSVRNRRDGDRIRIMGLNGSKKVKDIFIDDKISKSNRSRQPIILNGDNTILWIPGIRRSIYAGADKSTARILCMEVSHHYNDSSP